MGDESHYLDLRETARVINKKKSVSEMWFRIDANLYAVEVNNSTGATPSRMKFAVKIYETTEQSSAL